jgi:hypothetical protein
MMEIYSASNISRGNSGVGNSVSGPVAAAQEALSAMLAGAGSPFLVQIVEGAVVVETASNAAVAWLRSQEASELMFLAQVGSWPTVSFLLASYGGMREVP